jgi:hypothetical protein
VGLDDSFDFVHAHAAIEKVSFQFGVLAMAGEFP